jgi:transposase
MRSPIFVRPLTETEHQALTAGLRASDAFVLRRCQILLASSRGERAPRIAEHLGCDDQTVLDALHAFNAQGLEALKKGAFRPKHTPLVFGPEQAEQAEQAEQLRALLHRPPRDFGYPTSVWTLDLAAQASVEQGVVSTRVSGETIRQTLLRLGQGWKRAKHWITRPDPEYTRKKADATV